MHHHIPEKNAATIYIPQGFDINWGLDHIYYTIAVIFVKAKKWMRLTTCASRTL